MRREAFIRADMDVRFITVDKVAAALPAIDAAALPPKEAAGTIVTEKLVSSLPGGSGRHGAPR